jgi:hypothetical protein
VIGDALRAVGATRFLFVGPGVFLNTAIWPKVREALNNTGTRIEFFEVADGIAALPSDVDRFPGSAACFAWSTAAFVASVPKMPIFINGLHGDNELRRASTWIVVHQNAARRSDAGVARGRLAMLVNLDALACSREAAANA